jgi:hypothetical protein
VAVLWIAQINFPQQHNEETGKYNFHVTSLLSADLKAELEVLSKMLTALIKGTDKRDQ